MKKPIGQFQIEKEQLLNSKKYSLFENIYSQIITDDEERERFFNILKETIEECKVKGSCCINVGEKEHKIYIFQLENNDNIKIPNVENLIFIKDTLTDCIFVKELRVLH